jgi:hypothetical protein
MKKYVLIFLLSLLVFPNYSYGQKRRATKKSVAKTATVQQPRSEIDIVKDSAEHWFKTIYADKALTDPYSYRLVNIKAEPVTARQHLEREKAKYQAIMDTTTIPLNERSESDLIEWKKMVAENEQGMKDNENAQSEYGRRKYEIYRTYYIKCLQGQQKLEEYLLTKQYRDKADADLNSLSNEALDKILFYDIYLDCYSKNNIGNEVLGRYKFPYSTSGPLGQENGMNTVEKLN